MTQCSSEINFPIDGLGWNPPDPLRCELESERLIVRAYTMDDARAMYDAVAESREGHLLPWMPWCKENHRTLESSMKYVCDQMLALQNPATFNNVGTGIFCKQTGRFIGGAGVHDVRRDTASCETGYWVRKSEIGHGYAREACARTISWALESQNKGGLGLSRVRIYCSAANTRSRRLVEQLGIRAEVHQREDYFVEGFGCTDRLGWGVLKSEWDCSNHRVVTPPSA